MVILESSEMGCPKNTHILQEFIEGENICSYGFSDNSILKFNICYKSPFKTKKAFTAFVPIECETINGIVKKIVKKLNLTGNISFDFIRKGEQYYIIECNPRITSRIHIIHENNFTELFFSKYSGLLKCKMQLFLPTLITSIRLLFYKDIIYNSHDLTPFFNQIQCLMTLNSIAKKNKISISKATVFDIEWDGKELID